METIQLKKADNLRLELNSVIDINILAQRLKFLNEREQELKERIYKLESEINNFKSQSLLDPEAVLTLLQILWIYLKLPLYNKRKNCFIL